MFRLSSIASTQGLSVLTDNGVITEHFTECFLVCIKRAYRTHSCKRVLKQSALEYDGAITI